MSLRVPGRAEAGDGTFPSIPRWHIPLHPPAPPPHAEPGWRRWCVGSGVWAWKAKRGCSPGPQRGVMEAKQGPWGAHSLRPRTGSQSTPEQG